MLSREDQPIVETYRQLCRTPNSDIFAPRSLAIRRLHSGPSHNFLLQQTSITISFATMPLIFRGSKRSDEQIMDIQDEILDGSTFLKQSHSESHQIHGSSIKYEEPGNEYEYPELESEADDDSELAYYCQRDSREWQRRPKAPELPPRTPSMTEAIHKSSLTTPFYRNGNPFLGPQTVMQCGHEYTVDQPTAMHGKLDQKWECRHCQRHHIINRDIPMVS